jgi:hypothetical protein
LVAPVLLQEDGAPGWDFRYLPPSGAFLSMALGNIPASVISLSIRPDGEHQWRGHVWDPSWFLLHESIAAPIWFLFGWAAGTGTIAPRPHVLFLGFRVLTATFCRSDTIARLAGIGGFLFWLCISGYLAFIGIRWLARRLPLRH